MKMNCFNKKAQTLTELASFGSALLLALSFFIRYGMYYNYQQQAQMEAFRWAMKLSYKQNDIGDFSNLVNSNPLVLARDVHIPDPRDRAGIGDRVTVMGSGEITWTNELQKTQGYEVEPRPRIFYLINPETAVVKEQAFSLADYAIYSWANTGGTITVTSLDKEFEIPQNQTKVYKEKISEEEYKQYLKVLLIPEDKSFAYCQTNYCPTDIVNAADVDNDDKYEHLIEVGNTVDSPVEEFATLDFQIGDINADYINNLYVPADEVQGLLPDKEVGIQRSDSLTLEETPAFYQSNTKVNTTEKITHKIRGNYVENLLPNPYTFTRNEEDTWGTPK